MSNKNLHTAQNRKYDEFYTMMETIESEIPHYASQFEGKTVYCNCDDYRYSNFPRYFFQHFAELKLKRLIVTCYAEPMLGERSAYAVDIDDVTGLKYEDIEGRLLEGDGSYKSAECLEYLEQADIVCTNPPFSLFRDYIDTLEAHHKKYLIIGNFNAVTCSNISRKVIDGDIKIGYSRRGMYFDVKRDGEWKNEYVNTCWFTNLDKADNVEKLELTCKYSPEKYPKYDNFDAIEVGKVKEIPYDYYGMMGVPITFLEVYCPEQFELIGFFKTSDISKKEEYGCVKSRMVEYIHPDGTSHITNGPVINKKAKYIRIIIKRVAENSSNSGLDKPE